MTMFELTIGSLKLDDYVTEFSVDASPKKDENAFENYDGTTIRGYVGDIITLDIKLKKVPTALSQELSAALAAETVNVSYTSPSAVSAVFTKNSYSAASRSKGPGWDISISLESAAPVGGSYL